MDLECNRALTLFRCEIDTLAKTCFAATTKDERTSEGLDRLNAPSRCEGSCVDLAHNATVTQLRRGRKTYQAAMCDCGGIDI